MNNHPNRSRRPSPLATPMPQTVRDARMAAGLSQREAASLVRSTLRAWQGWESDLDSTEHRRMPPGLWELFRLKLELARATSAAPVAQIIERQGLFVDCVRDPREKAAS